MINLSDLQALQEIRERKQMIAVIITEGVGDLDTLKQEVEDLEERRREIIQKISSMPQRERNLLLLHYDMGLTWEDTAKALGIGVRWMFRIRKSIVNT